uniref:L-serine deaminase n=1 Tax=Astyanax mexicanus TaxID=7994 RepID=A0A3B1KCD0_ASTMX
MNFAAQFFYANYTGEGTPPRRRYSDNEEYDPFWQRWEESESQIPKESLNVKNTKCLLESTSVSSDNVMALEHSSEPSTSKDCVVARTPFPAACPTLAHSNHSAVSSPKLPRTQTSRKVAPSTVASASQISSKDPPSLPSTNAVERLSIKKLQPTNCNSQTSSDKAERSNAGTLKKISSEASSVSKSKASSDPPPASAPPPPQGSPALPIVPSSSHLLNAPRRRTLLPEFHTVICFLLRLFLSFILLFLPREEQRLSSTKKKHSTPDGQYHKDGPIANGAVGRRPTLICPERLRDFGAEEYLNGDVKTFETRVVGGPEVQLMAPPKPSVKRSKEYKPSARPPVEYLRFEDISTATLKIQQAGIQKTPCTYSRLSKLYGMEIYLKKEHLHYTGSLKERGVLYLLSTLKQDQQKKGVIVATDCNFSMAVAYHAVELRIPVFVIMPAYSSPPRLRMYRDYGAMVISYGSTARDSQNHARHLARENGYLCLEEDDSAVYLAGLGTVGIEIYEQVPKLDAVIVPAGGQCAVLAATAAAIKHLNPRISVIGVEPEEFPLLLQSFKTDSPIKDLYCNPNRKLYGDLVQHSLGTHTFQLAKKLVDKVISVREEDSLVAMLRFQEYEHTTVDTEGAMGLAAILAGQLPELKGKRVAVLVSSANMELDLVRQCVDRALVLDDRVSRFTVQLGDWPGDMAKLLDMLAREDVRLLDVCHSRYSDKAELFKAQVECVVETRDKTQNCQLRRTLSDRYPTLRWLDR